MKTIAILLAILGYAAAQKLSACVVLDLGAAMYNLGAGFLDFEASTRENETLVSGEFWALQPGKYMVVAHESRKFSRDCNDLGPIVELEPGRPFILTEFEVKAGKPYVTGSPSTGTLVLNLPNSIFGRTIAIYDSVKFALFQRNPAIPMEACAIISTESQCML